jgi:hypothetical protein
MQAKNVNSDATDDMLLAFPAVQADDDSSLVLRQKKKRLLS